MIKPYAKALTSGGSAVIAMVGAVAAAIAIPLVLRGMGYNVSDHTGYLMVVAVKNGAGLASVIASTLGVPGILVGILVTTLNVLFMIAAPTDLAKRQLGARVAG